MAKAFRCDLLSWQAVHRAARDLAAGLRTSGSRPDLLVAIGRGGYVPGRLLSDFLHQKELTSFRVEHYGAGAEKKAEARVVGSPVLDVAGRRVLVVDDVNDTGESLAAAVAFVRAGGPASVETAVLHQKAATTHGADHVARHLSLWRWIIYPWAAIEDLTAFVERLEPRPTSRRETAQRLAETYGLRVPDRLLADVFSFAPPPPP